MTEEVALVLATLAACGLLVLGTLELIWPTRPRRSGAARTSHHAAAPAAPGAAPAAPGAARAAPVAARGPRRAPGAPPFEDRAAVALRVGRTLLGRALEDPDPASDRRLRMVCRAIACLNRGIETAPGDARLHEALAAAHEALEKADPWTVDQRLTAEMPWRVPAFAHAGEASGPR
ncbi:MAG: hypothetical protein HYU25_12930 [Candidatus Rokubacteria bacterium]|nr:hypothetical protein [Candidatus Rokubacteria bacterium]